MSTILSATPLPSVDGHVDLSFDDRAGWSESLGATILGILAGDERCGPFVVLSYVEPMEEQMPLSFAHAHASDNWRISVRGTTNMGRDTYEQGQFRFHDGGVPYASDNFAWGPDGGLRDPHVRRPPRLRHPAGEGRDRGDGRCRSRRRPASSSGSTCRTRVPAPRPSPRRWARPRAPTSTAASTPRTSGTRSHPACAWPPASRANPRAGRCWCSSTAPPAARSSRPARSARRRSWPR